MIKRPVVEYTVFLLLLIPVWVMAGEESKVPQEGQWVTENTGRFLPLDLSFIDGTGTTILLSDIIDRPTIFLLQHGLFLTGERENIKIAMDAVGFRFKNVGDGLSFTPRHSWL